MVPCPLCGSFSWKPAFVRADNGKVVRCVDCGLLYLNPRPTESSIAGLYDQSYFTQAGHGSAYHDYLGTDLAAMENGAHSGFLAMDVLKRHISPSGKLLLDVGCGCGTLLQIARQRGYTVRGIEISAYMAAQARKLFHLDVEEGRLEDANFDDEEFDVVTALEVLEHLTDPVSWLREIHRVLKPGGWLLLTTPNGRCPHKYRNEWVGFTKSFEHLTFFDEGTIIHALKLAGLSMVGVWTRGNRLAANSVGKDPVVGMVKRAVKDALSAFPRLTAEAQRRRQLWSLKPSHQRPFGHNLCVVATRPLSDARRRCPR